MSGITSIRRGVQADADAIAALTREAYAKWVELIGREPLPMTVDYAEAVKSHRFDLLFAGTDFAALIETVPQGGWLMIENVAVRPAFQRRGYGVRLLRLAETLSVESGLRGTRLYTNQRFTANLGLYASLGYRVEREAPHNGGVTVHMAKPRA
jgi:ribosomal protein S18 acetylase RimI-like enzyme